jgi:hypothetical protein
MCIICEGGSQGGGEGEEEGYLEHREHLHGAIQVSPRVVALEPQRLPMRSCGGASHCTASLVHSQLLRHHEQRGVHRQPHLEERPEHGQVLVGGVVHLSDKERELDLTPGDV